MPVRVRRHRRARSSRVVATGTECRSRVSNTTTTAHKACCSLRIDARIGRSRDGPVRPCTAWFVVLVLVFVFLLLVLLLLLLVNDAYRKRPCVAPTTMQKQDPRHRGTRTCFALLLLLLRLLLLLLLLLLRLLLRLLLLSLLQKKVWSTIEIDPSIATEMSRQIVSSWFYGSMFL